MLSLERVLLDLKSVLKEVHLKGVYLNKQQEDQQQQPDRLLQEKVKGQEQEEYKVNFLVSFKIS